MRPSARVLLFAMALGMAATPPAGATRRAAAAAPASDLTADVDAVLADPSLATARAGVIVVRLGDGPADSRVVYRRNADVPLTPASNLKLLTTSAAVDRLGPDFQFRTQLVRHGPDLVLVGDGDPAFGDAKLLAPAGWTVDTVFKQWAAQLKPAGVTTVRNVVVDDSVFDDARFHPRWPADQRLAWYEAEVGGLNLNDNCLDLFLVPTAPGQLVRVEQTPATAYVRLRNGCRTGPGDPDVRHTPGVDPDANDDTLRGHAAAATPDDHPLSVSVRDPGLYAGTVLAERLAAAGVPVTGDVRRDNAARDALAKRDPAYAVLAINQTPLSGTLGRANKDSMNLYGECLCKRLGAATTGRPGSWANGTAAVAAFLTGKVGLDPAAFHLDDGCGLSKANAVTPAAVAAVLSYDHFSANAALIEDSLSVAGTDGTLARFGGPALRGRVHAKTGTVAGVSCMSGYLHAKAGHTYVFAILLNHLDTPGKPVQERVLRAIDAADH